MSRHHHHDDIRSYDRDVARHLSYESFGRQPVSDAEITPEAKPAAPQLTEDEVDKDTVAQ